MQEVSYSHSTVWCLLHSYPVMEYEKNNNTKMWREFVRKIQDETGQVYPYEHYGVHITISKMADDLGSYAELSNIWCALEEAYDYVRDISLDYL